MVLDWYGPEADPVYWRRGRGGGGGRTPGTSVKHTFKRGKYWGIPPEKNWEFRHHLMLIIYPVLLCRLPLPGHSYILISLPPLYRFHACAIPHVH